MIVSPLKKILARAYPCAAMCGKCQTRVRYAPEQGLIPRGYAGACADLSDVRLVLCLAEPGEPSKDETYIVTGSPDDLIDYIAALVGEAYRSSASAFHRNIRFILDCCWPRIPFDEQLTKTWITEAVLCSANLTTGPVKLAVEEECATRYLSRQLALLPHAFVIALGKKAQRRLELAKRPADFVVRAAGRPIGSRAVAEATWKSAGLAFQAFTKREVLSVEK